MSAELLYPLTGGSLSAIGAALLLWALFRDRSRGRLRCPKCWYRMEGVPETESAGQRIRTCPECGRACTGERQLRRTRRRKRWAAVALLLLISGWGVWKFPQARARGLWSYAPTTVLILLRDLAYEYDWSGSEVGAELLQRVYDGKVTSWQLAKINPPELVHLVELPYGDGTIWPEATPLLVTSVAPRWFSDLWRERSLVLSARVPGSLEVEFPIGGPTHGDVYVESWPSAADALALHGEARKRVQLFRALYGSWVSDSAIEFPPVPSGTLSVDVIWSLRRGSPGGRTIWSGTRTLAVRVLPEEDPEVDRRPVRADLLDELVRNRFIAGVDRDAPVFCVRLRKPGPEFEEVNLATRIELCREDLSMASARVTIQRDQWNETPSSISFNPLLTASTPDQAELSDWSIRISTDRGAMAFYGVTGPYWDGDITIPLSEILAREPEP